MAAPVRIEDQTQRVVDESFKHLYQSHPCQAYDPSWPMWQSMIDDFEYTGGLSRAERDSDPGGLGQCNEGIGITIHEAHKGGYKQVEITTNDQLMHALTDNPREAIQVEVPSDPVLRIIYLPPRVKGQECFDANTLRILFHHLEMPPSYVRILKDGFSSGVNSYHTSTEESDSTTRRSYVWYSVSMRTLLPATQCRGFPLQYLSNADPSKDLVVSTDLSLCVVCDHATAMVTVILRSLNTFVNDCSSHMEAIIANFLPSQHGLSLSSYPLNIHLGVLTVVSQSLFELFVGIESLLIERISTLATENTISYRGDEQTRTQIIAECNSLNNITVDYAKDFRNLLGICSDLDELIVMHEDKLVISIDGNAAQQHIVGEIRNLSRRLRTYIERAEACLAKFKMIVNTRFHLINEEGNQHLRESTRKMAENTEVMKQLIAQGHDENLIMTEIARKTNSFAMKSISIVTILYLPGAFVSLIFGMQLIWVQDNRLNIVTGWQYFVILTVVLTVATFAIWYIWISRGPNDGTLKLVVKKQKDHELKRLSRSSSRSSSRRGSRRRSRSVDRASASWYSRRSLQSVGEE